MRVILTGSAGFIGFHLARRLLAEGVEVTGIDSMTPYYSPALKERRLQLLSGLDGFDFHRLDIADAQALGAVFKARRPDIVVHLAAQAGVRNSISDPQSYVSSNIVGTFNLIEACRAHPPRHLMLASTSSIYGASPKMPFRENARTAEPLTLYAASKGAAELMAHSYAHLFAIPTTAIRFFTVYGPWGRPDMAYYIFTRKILAGEPIEINNDGASIRDFTYIDDLVEALMRLVDCVPGAEPVGPDDSLSAVAPFRIVNAGGGQPVRLSDFVAEIERATGRQARRILRPLPAGDAQGTFACGALLRQLTGYLPVTPVDAGIPRFVDWYRAEGNEIS